MLSILMSIDPRLDGTSGHLPSDDMTIVSRKEQLRRLQDSVTEALQNKFATKWNLPIFVTTYAVPMEERDHPIVSSSVDDSCEGRLRSACRRYSRNLRKILTNVSLYEQKTTDGKQNGRQKTLFLNAIWILRLRQWRRRRSWHFLLQALGW